MRNWKYNKDNEPAALSCSVAGINLNCKYFENSVKFRPFEKQNFYFYFENKIYNHSNHYNLKS